LAGDADGLKIIGFPDGRDKIVVDPAWEYRVNCFPDVQSQLAEYFQGRRRSFHLKRSPSGTDFQLAVLG